MATDERAVMLFDKTAELLKALERQRQILNEISRLSAQMAQALRGEKHVNF